MLAKMPRRIFFAARLPRSVTICSGIGNTVKNIGEHDIITRSHMPTRFVCRALAEFHVLLHFASILPEYSYILSIREKYRGK